MINPPPFPVRQAFHGSGMLGAPAETHALRPRTGLRCTRCTRCPESRAHENIGCGRVPAGLVDGDTNPPPTRFTDEAHEVRFGSSGSVSSPSRSTRSQGRILPSRLSSRGNASDLHVRFPAESTTHLRNRVIRSRSASCGRPTSRSASDRPRRSITTSCSAFQDHVKTYLTCTPLERGQPAPTPRTSPKSPSSASVRTPGRCYVRSASWLWARPARAASTCSRAVASRESRESSMRWR